MEKVQFEFCTPVFKKIKDGRYAFDTIVGEWTIAIVAELYDVKDHDYRFSIESMSFKKSIFEKIDLTYNDIYIQEEKLQDIVSEYIFEHYQK